MRFVVSNYALKKPHTRGKSWAATSETESLGVKLQVEFVKELSLLVKIFYRHCQEKNRT